MSFRHWSRNVLLIAPDLLSTASYIRSLKILEGWASCTAILVTNTQASWTPPLPLEKKKLARRHPVEAYSQATMRDIVDLPVPAQPHSQNMYLSSSVAPSVWDSVVGHWDSMDSKMAVFQSLTTPSGIKLSSRQDNTESTRISSFI
jgi:hypothetical protein